MTTIQTILLKYLTMGHHKIRILYSGGGDSGAVEEIYAENNDSNATYPIDKNDYTFLENYFYKNLSNLINGDWVNNEGGNGYCILNTLTGEYELETELYFTDSNHDSNYGQLIDISET